MKKMIVTIIILFIIFISMVIYRNMEKENELKVDEINKIEEYIGKIYGWKEITNEALPEFDDINNAEEKWIWNSIRENLSDFEVEYDQIENKIKELYGTNLKKQYRCVWRYVPRYLSYYMIIKAKLSLIIRIMFRIPASMSIASWFYQQVIHK